MSSNATVRRAEVPSMCEARRRATRYWRTVTAIYLVALTAGTHWPQLSVGVGPGPPPDKVLHFFAFGGLTLLLWQCRFVSRIWIVGSIVAAWVLFDEWTQSLAIFRRQTSWTDVTAGWAGVMCAVIWLWATAPVGGKVARWRRELFDQVVDERLSRTMGWVWLGCGAFWMGIFTAFVSCIWWAVFQFMSPQEPPRDPFIMILITFCLGTVFGVHVVFCFWNRSHRDRISFKKCCFECGVSCEDVEFNVGGSSTCDSCGADLHNAQWTPTPFLSLRYRWEGLTVGALSALLLSPFLYGLCRTLCVYLFQSDNSISRTSLDSIVNLSTVLAAASIMVGIARQFFARRVLLFDEECGQCEYDLRGQLCIHGVGTCPECGTPFVRLDERTHNESGDA